VNTGAFEGVDLADLHLTLYADSPGPLHLGNVTSGFIFDDRATPAQRDALVRLASGKEGGPWAIFAAVTARWLDPLYAGYEVTIDGLNSRCRAGTFSKVELSKVNNPVRGTPEDLRLLKPTGFTSKWADLGKTKVFRVSTPQLSFEHSGQYGEFSEFEYAGS
jgi:hypothetical protein